MSGAWPSARGAPSPRDTGAARRRRRGALDAKGERLVDPIEVKEGYVMSVAFGPGGTIAAGYRRAPRRRRGAA